MSCSLHSHPSYASNRVHAYIVTTKDGHVHDGVLAHETPAVITLREERRRADETILRSTIQEIRASSISADAGGAGENR